MDERLPFPPRMFRVLYALIKHVKIPLIQDDISYLIKMRCIDPVIGGGWIANSRGRTYWRQFKNTQAVHDALVEEMPMETIFWLRQCEHNHNPKLEPVVVDNLVRAGYLLQPPTGGVMLTTKGHDLVRSYNRILADLA